MFIKENKIIENKKSPVINGKKIPQEMWNHLFNKSVSFNSNSNSCYYLPLKRKINVTSNVTLNIIVHEVGHALFSLCLSETQKNIFKKMVEDLVFDFSNYDFSKIKTNKNYWTLLTDPMGILLNKDVIKDGFIGHKKGYGNSDPKYYAATECFAECCEIYYGNAPIARELLLFLEKFSTFVENNLKNNRFQLWIFKKENDFEFQSWYIWFYFINDTTLLLSFVKFYYNYFMKGWYNLPYK